MRTNAFNADARHSFDDFCKFFEDLDHSNDHVHQRFAAKSTTFIDGLSDRIAEGKRLTDAQLRMPSFGHLLPLQPTQTCSTHAQGARHGRRASGTMSTESSRCRSSSARSRASLSPRWEALKDLGNDALKAGDYKLAITWYKRAEAGHGCRHGGAHLL